MHDSKRYRSNAADCLMAAQDACRLGNRGIYLSMAASWLSLARQHEAMDHLLASWEGPRFDPGSSSSALSSRPSRPVGIREHRPARAGFGTRLMAGSGVR